MQLSANLGFLFTELPFAERLRAAARAGFRAVEFHDQAQQLPPEPLAAVLEQEGLRLCSLNCAMGTTGGTAALPRAEAEFRRDFLDALTTAQHLNARGIHILTGRTSDAGAEAVLLRNLEFALSRTDRMLLLEVISPAAQPGYWMNSPERFLSVLDALPDPRLKLIGDWYHFSQIFGSSALAELQALAPHLGHLQLARPSDRGDPLPGDLPDWPGLRQLALENDLHIGLEYRPARPPEEVLRALSA